MAKQAISVTLDTANITWLKARVGASSVRSVSELIDRLIADARAKAPGGKAVSVVGTIDIDESAPLLLDADSAIRDMFEQSLRRPSLVKETRASYTASARPRKGSQRG